MFPEIKQRRYRRRPTLQDHPEAIGSRKRQEAAAADLDRFKYLLARLVV